MIALQRAGGPILKAYADQLATFAAVTGEDDGDGAGMTEGEILAVWAATCQDTDTKRGTFKPLGAR